MPIKKAAAPNFNACSSVAPYIMVKRMARETVVILYTPAFVAVLVCVSFTNINYLIALIKCLQYFDYVLLLLE